LSKTLNWTPCGTGTMKKRPFVFISAAFLNSHVTNGSRSIPSTKSRSHYRGASTCTPTSQTDSPRSRRLQSFVTLAAHLGVRRVRRQHPHWSDRADQIRRVTADLHGVIAASVWRIREFLNDLVHHLDHVVDMAMNHDATSNEINKR
jgi:hypothetical protein